MDKAYLSVIPTPLDLLRTSRTTVVPACLCAAPDAARCDLCDAPDAARGGQRAAPHAAPSRPSGPQHSVADPKAFRSGRNFSAWVGLEPKQNSSGSKERLGSINKQGDRYLRSLAHALSGSPA